jgi:hypothetical protein
MDRGVCVCANAATYMSSERFFFVSPMQIAFHVVFAS